MDKQEPGEKARPEVDHLGETSTVDPLRVIPAPPDPGQTPNLSLAMEGGSAALAPGRTLAGRYTILHWLGQGGMGVVLAAYDARLDRRVALKLLRHEGGSQRDSRSEQRARHVREAMAMARLSHPNVVAVYDAGSLEDGSLFIAMEYVEGQTLRRWCARQAPSWRVILDVFLAAGRGLAAAHATGLVHRDFKPDNVLVDQAGRVRVTDFGLARQSEGADAESGNLPSLDASTPPDGPSPRTQLPARSTHPLEMLLTRKGAILGTPAYMAPEQLLGTTVDARSDQFSFAVALWEALHGEPPFEGDTLAARQENVLAARIKVPSSHSKVPSWVQDALRRALDPRPEARYPTLDTLLAALGRDPVQRRRWWFSAAALLLLVAVLGPLAYGLWSQHTRLCTGGLEKLVGIWDGPRQQAIEKAFFSTDRDYARDTWIRVRGALDAYTVAWVDMYQDTCEATRLRGEQSEEIMSLRMACLEGRRQELAALTEVFTHADSTVVEKAISATSSLRRLRVCADVESLMAEVKPPEDVTTRRAVETARAQLARIKAFMEAGKYQVALQLATEVTRETRPLGYKPIHAEALFMQAWTQLLSGEAKEVVPSTLSEALWLAHDSRHDSLVAAASVRLMGYYSSHGPPEEAAHWERFAGAWLDRLGENGELRAIFHNNRGLALFNQGQFAEAYEAFDKAFALAEKQLGPAHATTLRYATNSLAALGNLDRIDASQRALETLVRLGETNLGPHHPFLTQPLTNLSDMYALQGRLSDARRLLDQVREIGQQAYGDRSEEWAQFHLSYGDLESEAGRDAEALGHYEEAVRLYQELTGPRSLEVQQALVKVAEAQLSLERLALAQRTLQQVVEETKKDPRQYEQVYPRALIGLADVYETRAWYDKALRLRQEALEVRERLLGAEHLITAFMRVSIGTTLLELGQPARALALFEREQALFAKTLGADTPTGVLPLEGRGEALLKLGRPTEALPLLEQALQVVEGHEVRPGFRASVQFAVARALWDAGQQPERAVQLARAARATYAKRPLLHAHALAEVDALLKRHGSDSTAPRPAEP